MKISQLIKKLQELQMSQGDLTVYVASEDDQAFIPTPDTVDDCVFSVDNKGTGIAIISDVHEEKLAIRWGKEDS